MSRDSVGTISATRVGDGSRSTTSEAVGTHVPAEIRTWVGPWPVPAQVPTGKPLLSIRKTPTPGVGVALFEVACALRQLSDAMEEDGYPATKVANLREAAALADRDRVRLEGRDAS